MSETLDTSSETVLTPTINNEWKNLPQLILFFIIFAAQFFSKRREILNSNKDEEKLNPEQLEIGKKLQMRYIIVFQISKMADWCLGPFVFEFFNSYHNLPVSEIAHYIAISYIASSFQFHMKFVMSIIKRYYF